MSLLPEYVLTPDVLLEDEQASTLGPIYREWLRYGLVRNIYISQWRKLVLASKSERARELFKVLQQSGRIIAFNKHFLPRCPVTPEEWCQEALDGHNHRPLNAIVASLETIKQFPPNSPVVTPANYFEHEGFRPYQSLQLKYEISQYCHALQNVFRRAGQVCFIDPYIDPTHLDYRDFPKFFEFIAKHRSASEARISIQIHRMEERGRSREKIKSEDKWREVFREWDQILIRLGLKVSVHIWTKFVNRYFLCSYFGLTAGKGFQSNSNKLGTHTWARLEERDADTVRREFETNGNSTSYSLVCRFDLGRL